MAGFFGIEWSSIGWRRRAKLLPPVTLSEACHRDRFPALRIEGHVDVDITNNYKYCIEQKRLSIMWNQIWNRHELSRFAVSVLLGTWYVSALPGPMARPVGVGPQPRAGSGEVEVTRPKIFTTTGGFANVWQVCGRSTYLARPKYGKMTADLAIVFKRKRQKT